MLEYLLQDNVIQNKIQNAIKIAKQIKKARKQQELDTTLISLVIFLLKNDNIDEAKHIINRYCY